MKEEVVCKIPDHKKSYLDQMGRAAHHPEIEDLKTGYNNQITLWEYFYYERVSIFFVEKITK